MQDVVRCEGESGVNFPVSEANDPSALLCGNLLHRLHVVERFRRNIRTVRPNDCSTNGIKDDLTEVTRVFQRLENRTSQLSLKVNHLRSTIIESQAKFEIAACISTSDAHDHIHLHSVQWRDFNKWLAFLRFPPILKQLRPM